MGVEALKYSPEQKPVRSELETESIHAFARMKAKGRPVAYVVCNEDLSIFRKFKDLVIDRGRKNEAKPLSKLLLGYERIPVLSGSYTSSGQLVRSVRTLLKNAVAQNDRNMYIIGAEEKIFRQLWDMSKGTDEEIASVGAGPQFESATIPPLSKVIPWEPVPAELVQRFVGESPEIQLVRQLIMKAARSKEAVLILGDTGTGKEVVARGIHDFSKRPGFTPVNCGAIPGDLLETLLFGIGKGVATNVLERDGLWTLSGKGTLFLDEIGDLSLDHQVKILRALQEGKIRPVGAKEEIPVNARVITATNRDLFSMVKSGQFREDLYYRLRSFLIRTPPLRDHPEDIRALAGHFWQEIAGSSGQLLPDAIMSELQQQRWPGNARELRAILANIYALFGADDLSVQHLRVVFQLEGHGAVSASKADADGISLHQVECLRHLRRVDEVVRAAKVTLRPIVEEKKTDAQTVLSIQSPLRQRIQELEVLCMRPLLFHSEVAFSVVHRLKGRLFYFHSLLQSDGRSALRYWKREVADEFKLVLSTIFQQVSLLTKS